jgi:hypothetical protein
MRGEEQEMRSTKLVFEPMPIALVSLIEVTEAANIRSCSRLDLRTAADYGELRSMARFVQGDGGSDCGSSSFAFPIRADEDKA